MPGTDNFELKLAINHIRLWLIHNNIPHDGLEVSLKVLGHGHDMATSFEARMTTEDLAALKDPADHLWVGDVRMKFTD